MKLWVLYVMVLLLASCAGNIKLPVPDRHANAISGTSFYKQVSSLSWKEREAIALKEILSGNMPSYLKKFVPVTTSFTDSNGKKRVVTFFAAPDYLSIGGDDDFARIPLTPMTAQQIADSLFCFLPTRKMVDDIYQQARVKLEPVPLYAFRDSAIVFWHHHLIIEGQRNGRKGLIAGIKKDIVISEKLARDAKPDRVAIYGWHKLDGNPIQPLYTGHVNWYVDYSHGIRLIYRKIKIDGKWMDYKDVLRHPVLNKLLCDEGDCDFTKYTY